MVESLALNHWCEFWREKGTLYFPTILGAYLLHTGHTCPIRQARSLACMSVEGFQSGSYSITLHTCNPHQFQANLR